MTIKEKTGAIKGYCDARVTCIGCPLRGNVPKIGKCHSDCTEEEIERNFNVVFGEGDDGVSEGVLADDCIPDVRISNAKNVYINYTINHFERLEENA